MRILLLLVVAMLASACGRQAVRASEKQFLADQVMVFDDDPHDASTERPRPDQPRGRRRRPGRGRRRLRMQLSTLRRACN